MHIPKATARRILEDMLSGCSIRTPHVLIVDSFALPILSSCTSISELTHKGVPVVEPLDNKNRQALPLAAIYFVRATKESIEQIIADFSDKKPKYKSAAIYTTSPLPDNLLEMLAPVEKYVAALKDVRCEYLSVDPRAMLLLSAPADPYAAGDRDRLSYAKQLASFLPNAAVRHGTTEEAKRMAWAYQQVAPSVAAVSSGSERPSRSSSAAAEKKDLIVFVDRSVDVVAPLLHEFTYEAMAHDVIFSHQEQSKDGKGAQASLRGESPPLFVYDYTNGKGEKESRMALLSDAADPLWASLKHTHIAEVIQYIQSQLPEQGMDVSSRNVAAVLKKMPEYTAKINQCSLHLTLVSACMKQFHSRQLDVLAQLEQLMACGDASSTQQKRLANDVLSLLDNPAISHEDKVRLIMIYIVCIGGVKETQRKALFSAAGLDQNEQEAVRNLSFFGVQVAIGRGASKNIQRQQSRFASKKKSGGGNNETDVPFEFSRYVPLLKDIIVAQLKNSLPDSEYPYMGGKEAKSSYNPAKAGRTANRDDDEDEAASGDATAARSLRSSAGGRRWGGRKKEEDNTAASASSTAKKEKEDDPDVWDEKRPKLCFYVVGGCTYSELRALHEAAQEYSGKSAWDLCIATERIWTPIQFLDALADWSAAAPAPVDEFAGPAASATGGSRVTGTRGRQKKDDEFTLDVED
eukprot:ANDGO_00350.mRNA.1 Protein transport protein sec1